MAYEVGTASNLEDLFTRILRFLEGRPAVGTPSYSGTGNGALHSPDTLMGAPSETWTLTATSATSFSVVGSVSGAQAAATVGVEYSNAFVKFTITAGPVAFEAGDQFTFTVSASTRIPLERWEVLRLYRDNVVGITTALTQADGTGTDRTILQSFRYDPRSLGQDADNTSSDGYCLVSGYSSGITPIVIELRAAKAVASVRIQGVGQAAQTDNILQNFVLAYSDDGSSWTDALTVDTNPVYALQEVKSFAVPGMPGAHRYWRITPTRNQGGSTSGALAWKSLLLLDADGMPVNHYGSEVLLKALGAGGTEAIYTGIRSEYHAGTGWYNLFLNGYTGFNSLETSWFKQPGAIPHVGTPQTSLSLPMVPCWNEPMPYWFAGNGRSFRFGVKVSTSFEGGYLGFILPYATPSQYPYPLAVGGSLVPHPTSRGTTWRFSVNVQHHSVFTIPGCLGNPAQTTESTSTTLYLRLPTGEWGFVGNRYAAGSDPDAITTMERTQGQRRGLWPTSFRTRAGDSSRRDFRECLGGGYILEPLIIHQRLPTPVVHGELEGVFCISGFGNAAENTFTLGGVDHVVLQNVARTDVHEYWALSLNP